MKKFKKGDIFKCTEASEFIWIVVGFDGERYLLFDLGSPSQNLTTSSRFGHWELDYELVTSIFRKEEE